MSYSFFILWTFILLARPQDFFPELALLRLALVFALLTAVLSFLEHKKVPFRHLVGLKEGKYYLLFFLAMVVGVPFASYKRMAFDTVFLTYLANMLFFYYTLVHVSSLQKLKTFLFTAALSAFTYASVSLAQGLVQNGRFSFGTMYDSNDLAFFLVSLFPLSLYFIAGKEGVMKRNIALAGVAVTVLVILLTGSRGGFLGLAAVLVLILFSRQAAIKPWARLTVLAVIAVVAVLSLHRIDTERYASLGEISTDYNVSSETGRLKIWKGAVQIILSNPVTGVGANCFPTALSSLGETQGRRPRWQAVHNSYLQIAAETGIIGFLPFMTLISASLKTFSLRRRNEPRTPEERELAPMIGLFRVAFIGCLIPAFFLTHGYSIIFTVFFAFSAIVRRMSTQVAPQEAPARTAGPSPAPFLQVPNQAKNG